MKLPEFLRKSSVGQHAAPHKDAIISTLSKAKAHIVSQGGKVEDDNPFEGPRFNVLFRQFHHGGLTAEAVIHIADEDARAVAKRRVPRKGRNA